MLAANTPTIGTGAWSVTSGSSLVPSQFSSTHGMGPLADPLATFTPAGGASAYILTWTITNAPCTASSSNVTINANATPPAPIPFPSAPVIVSGTANLVSNAGDYGTNFITRWYSGFTGGPVLATGDSYTPTVSSTQNFYATIYNTTTGCESQRMETSVDVRQYLATPVTLTKFSVRAEGVQQDVQLYNLPNTQSDSTLIYLDGLGRPIQKVNKKSSPLNFDIVTPVEYDANGRTSKDYLPYVSPSHSGKYQVAYATQQSGFYVATGDKIADDSKPYALANYEASPLGRLLEQGAPGQTWQPGTGHSQKVAYSFNTGATASQGEEVRFFNADGTSSSFYAANTLMRTQVTDANGHLTITYTDGAGRTMAKKQQLDNTISGTMVNYLETYYVYNNLGQLVYVLPPKAVAQLKATSWAVNQTFFDTWCSQFVYDYRGRLIQKKTPGQAAIFTIYDNLNRAVLIQNGFLRATNQWQFVKYDIRNRPVMSGLYTDAINTTRSALQLVVNTVYTASNPNYPPANFYESQGTALHGYTNVSFPKTNGDGTTAIVVQNVSYYDNYDFDNNGTADYSYATQGLTNEGVQSRSFRMATGGKSLVLGTSTWLYSYVFYDKYGRVIQTRANNHLSTTVDNLTTVTYDPLTGLSSQSKTYHNAGGTNQFTILQTTAYDAKGRPTSVSHSINGAPNQVISQYQYNELGQTVAKQLHKNPDNSFVQTVDLRYNIRGWLTSINNAQLTNDGGITNADTNDFFGMEMVYEGTDGTGLTNTPLYNGNASAVKWKTAGTAAAGTAGERSYLFSYDKTDQLLTASFQKYGTAWNQEQNTLNESMTYDHNGNVLTLNRKQNVRTVAGMVVTNKATIIDSLNYTYATGNQLSKVDDAATNTSGFSDGANQTTEYSYDSDGNMIADANKGISAITYNQLGKAQQITFTDGRTVVYTYNTRGTKLKMASTVSGVTTTTDYVSGFVYTNNALNFFSSPGGRVVKNGSNFEYQYAITDHLGNTRVLFTSAAQTAIPSLADFDGDANDQVAQFQNVTTIVPYTAANHTPGGSKVVRLNQVTPVGPARSLKVFPGDKIDMEVYSYYEATSGYGTSNTAIAGLITAVTSALVNGGPDAGGLKSSGVSSALNGFGVGPSQGDTQPAAYLNYILFDANYKVMDAGWKVVPAGSFTKQYVNIPTITVKEAGYMFVYLSYEDQSNNYIYFDDFKVTLTPTSILQNNEYYPFGLQTAASWTRDNTTNKFLYDAGSELNSTTAMYDLPFRNYDAALGRFFQVDALAHRSSDFTPYHYASNNPVGANDPTGLVVQYYATPEDDPRNWRMTIHNDNPNFDPGGGPAGGGNWGDDNSGAPPPPDPYGDAQKVASGEMSHEEYLAKYSTGDYWLVYNEEENEEGSIDKSWTLYSNQTFWKDAGANYSSKGDALAFGVYKNGYGSEYWDKGTSASGPSLADLYLAGVGMAGWVAETQSDIVMGSRSGYTSGKINPNSPNVYSKATASKIYYGAKAVGWGLTAWSVYSNYNQYKNGEIGESRFSYNNLNSGVGVFAPQFAIPMAAGDYLGQKYSTEITNDVSQPGGFLFEMMNSTLNFLGIPTNPGGK
jgi:RHS repeat-associated protein